MKTENLSIDSKVLAEMAMQNVDEEQVSYEAATSLPHDLRIEKGIVKLDQMVGSLTKLQFDHKYPTFDRAQAIAYIGVLAEESE